ncbi:MAG: trigger factor [Pseudomonadota bacterium]
MQATNENTPVETLEKQIPAVATVNPLERTVDLQVSIAELEREADRLLIKKIKKIKIPGFRPGKVPMSVAKQYHGEQTRNEALGDIVDRLYREAISAQGLRVAGYPRIQPKEADEQTNGKEAGVTETLVFSAVFEVYPEIQLASLNQVEVERPLVEIGVAEVDRAIEMLRKQHRSFAPIERATAEGDQVVIDFLGKKEGVPFAGGEAKDYAFVLGEGSMLADFEKATLGLKSGEEKSFVMTFPSDYFNSEMAGQTVTFDILVKEVRAPKLPELNDELAKILGLEEGNSEKMRLEIENNLKREAKNRLKARLKSQVMDALLAANPVNVPTALVEMEIERLMQLARQDLAQRGVKVQNFPLQAEWFSEQAKRRVSLGLLISELVKVEGLQVKPEQLKAMVEEAAASYENPEEVVRWYYAQPQRLAEIEGAGIEDNVVDWALSNAKVIDKSLTFDELMALQAA